MPLINGDAINCVIHNVLPNDSFTIKVDREKRTLKLPAVIFFPYDGTFVETQLHRTLPLTESASSDFSRVRGRLSNAVSAITVQYMRASIRAYYSI